LLECTCPVMALNGRVEVGSRVSALRGEADMPRPPGPYQSDATDPQRIGVRRGRKVSGIRVG
ncbi:MAG: hypothetical protein WA763_10635, partial [Pseudolabrys sp.]